MILAKVSIARSFALALLVATIAAPAFAQDVRVNPFLPTSTAEERELLAQKERMRQSIREMMPEIRTMLQPVFEEQKTALLAEMEAQQEAAAEALAEANAAAGPAPLPGQGAPGAVAPLAGAAPDGGLTLPGTNIPATAKFVACFNGKAMYRDANGTKYFDENASAICPA